MEKKFDPMKPVRTRDGRPARIVGTLERDTTPFVLVAIVGRPGSERVERFTPDGRYWNHGSEDANDLVNAPEVVGRPRDGLKFVNLGDSRGSLEAAADVYRREWPVAVLEIKNGEIVSARLATTDDLDG